MHGPSWIGGILQRESLPVLEAAMSFAHQRQALISHNIANVNTPLYKRQALDDNRFRATLRNAIDEREDWHWNRFSPRDEFTLAWSRNSNAVHARVLPGQDQGPERHDRNTVVIEHELADLAKNTLYMQSLQQLYKKFTGQVKMAVRERIG